MSRKASPSRSPSTSGQEPDKSWLRPDTLAASSLAAVWLFHTTAIDRLDLSKLSLGAILVALCLSISFLFRRRQIAANTSSDGQPPTTGERPTNPPRRENTTIPQARTAWPVLGMTGLALCATACFSYGFLSSRVEAWASLVIAGILLSLVARQPGARIGGPISIALAALTLIGLAQAFGSDWFTSQVAFFATRPVMGTLGNPDYYGVCLAAALPLALTRSQHAAFKVLSVSVVAMVILSGSRTAWVMLIPATLAVLPLVTLRRVVLLALLGVTIGIGISASSQQLNLATRLDDLRDSRGTAAGRLYLWRINLTLLAEAGPVGHGPEGYRRVWPWAQAEFLSNNPEYSSFYSDLRHAHADLIELAVDWGWLALAVASIWLFDLLSWGWLRRQFFRRKARSSSKPTPEQIAARASCLALLVGGLALPVLFQPPTLFLGALACGVLLSPRELRSRVSSPQKPPIRLLLKAASLGAIILTLLPLAQRTTSEWLRTEGLKAELGGSYSSAREHYQRAAHIDPRNPLAQILLARSLLDHHPEGALQAASMAAEQLPTATTFALRALAAEATGESALADESWSLVLYLRPGLTAREED